MNLKLNPIESSHLIACMMPKLCLIRKVGSFHHNFRSPLTCLVLQLFSPCFTRGFIAILPWAMSVQIPMELILRANQFELRKLTTTERTQQAQRKTYESACLNSRLLITKSFETPLDTMPNAALKAVARKVRPPKERRGRAEGLGREDIGEGTFLIDILPLHLLLTSLSLTFWNAILDSVTTNLAL